MLNFIFYFFKWPMSNTDFELSISTLKALTKKYPTPRDCQLITLFFVWTHPSFLLGVFPEIYYPSKWPNFCRNMKSSCCDGIHVCLFPLLCLFIYNLLRL